MQAAGPGPAATPAGLFVRRRTLECRPRRMLEAMKVWLAISIALAMGCAPANSEPCATSSGCRDELLLRTGGRISYFRTVPLARNPTVRRAVIVVHGNGRDADRYYDRLVAAAKAESRLHDAALLAPHFRTEEDGPSPHEHYWSSQGWKIGNKSRDAGRVSSFAVMDELLARICSNTRKIFPALQAVVIVGHSAGGQFVNRYAAGGQDCPDPAVEVRYVVMNPSSYLYVDARRESALGGGFAVPAPDCEDYDEYKYGLADLNAYMKRVGPERIRKNLFEREIYYLAGSEDVKPGKSLDTSCPAGLQGPDRVARHASYRRYRELFDDWTGSVFATIPGVGHSGGEMLMSDTARRVTFR